MKIHNSDIICSHSLPLVNFADSFHPQKVITTFPLGQCKGKALESITQCMSLASVYWCETRSIWEVCPRKRMETRNKSPTAFTKSYFQTKHSVLQPKLYINSVKLYINSVMPLKQIRFLKSPFNKSERKKTPFSKTSSIWWK